MITVLAGVNGAGKSSIGGSALRSRGEEYYNPDEQTREIAKEFPDMLLAEVNSLVWHEGLNRLKEAIRNDLSFTFETTLGGNTITKTLLDAIAFGVPVQVWYCGLESVDIHIERVANRVVAGGHNIPEDKIRRRYDASMNNLCRLTPGLKRLSVFDNSRPFDSEGKPQISKLICMENHTINHMIPNMPQWAKPVAAVCLEHCKFRLSHSEIA